MLISSLLGRGRHLGHQPRSNKWVLHQYELPSHIHQDPLPSRLDLFNKLPLLAMAINLGDQGTSITGLSLSQKVPLEVVVVHAAAMATKDEVAVITNTDVLLVFLTDRNDGNVVLSNKDSPVLLFFGIDTEDETSAALISGPDLAVSTSVPVELRVRLGADVVAGCLYQWRLYLIVGRESIRFTTDDISPLRLVEGGHDSGVAVVKESVHDLVHKWRTKVIRLNTAAPGVVVRC